MNAGGPPDERPVNRARCGSRHGRRGEPSRGPRRRRPAGSGKLEGCPSTTPTLVRTERTTLRRKRERGSYDRAAGRRRARRGARVPTWASSSTAPPTSCPWPTPGSATTSTSTARPATGMLRRLAEGAPLCVTVTLVDGIVLARAAVHHSLNYRSVVLYGTADAGHRPRRDRPRQRRLARPHGTRARRRRPPAHRRRAAARRCSCGSRSTRARSRCAPGRRSTTPRTSGLGVWAGVIPLAVAAGAAEPDPTLAPRARRSPPTRRPIRARRAARRARPA